MTSLPQVLPFLSNQWHCKLNNEIRELEIQEQKEIEAVLASLSNQTAPHIEELQLDMELLAQLDFIFAKAALSHQYRCTAPFSTIKAISTSKTAATRYWTRKRLFLLMYGLEKTSTC